MSKAFLRLEFEDGAIREYRKDRIKARWIKEGMKHSKKIAELEKKGDGAAVIDARLAFTCEFFGDKDLTPDAILDGMESEQLIPKLDELFAAVMGHKEEGEPGKQ